MSSQNKIILIGTLNETPEVKMTTSGSSVCNFTLVVPRTESLPDNRFDYIRVSAWQENADKIAAQSKGSVIYVEGQINVDSYEDQNSGQRKWTTTVKARQLVNCNEVFNMSAGESTNLEGGQSVGAAAQPSASIDDIKDIPFTPANEAQFFDSNQPVESDSKELEEDVPF